MRAFTSVDLAFSWQEASRHLPRRWITVLSPYVDPAQSSILSARLIFPNGDPLLEELLDFAESKARGKAGSGGFLGMFSRKGDSSPLLRAVRRWNDYDFADLQGYPVVQLLLDRTIELAPPLSQIYRVEIEPASDCPGCGQVHLHQQHPLRVRGQADPEPGLRGDAWQPGDQIAATENHEIIISERLRDLWATAAAHESPQFSPVASVDDTPALWQVTPQGTARVMAPPTPLQVRDRCPMCGRPLTVALSTASSGVAFGSGRQMVYEQEALLTLGLAPLPAGDLWVTDLQEGRVRELTETLPGFADHPDPFYVRSSRPFWLISQRLLRLLHEHIPSGWRCRPANTLVIVACLVVLWAATACGNFGTGVKSGSNTLMVINGVDGPICTLHVKRASSQTFWGSNRLGSDQRLAPGDPFVVGGLAAGHYDVDAFLCDDDTHPGFLRYDVVVGPDDDGAWTIGQ